MDCNCGGSNGDRPSERKYGLALKFKSADERRARIKTKLNALSLLSALSGLLAVGAALFVVGLVVYAIWVV